MIHARPLVLISSLISLAHRLSIGRDVSSIKLHAQIAD
jgi:hypothetical protein